MMTPAIFDSNTTNRDTMVDFIRNNFSELLGDKLHLLDEPQGLEELSKMIQTGNIKA